MTKQEDELKMKIRTKNSCKIINKNNKKIKRYIKLISLSFLIILSIGFNVAFIIINYLPKKSDVAFAIQIEGIGTQINDLEDVFNCSWAPYKTSPVIYPELDSEMAGDNGNLYAPEIIYENGTYKMWYGGQSDDGHDQIHYAISDDGINWRKIGIAIPNNNYNHVNDPSVVKVNDTYYMFYTTAIISTNDVISLATSKDGLNWTIIGNVFLPSPVGNWDSFKVGRPSVIYEDGMFKMWYDGSEADPSDPSQIRPGTGRHVGYAFSYNGINWTRYSGNPIFLHGGAVDVEKIGSYYFIVEESNEGTIWGYSLNETDFHIIGFLFNKTGLDFDAYGHVTPFILKIDEKWVATYVGTTTDKCWCQNRISIWYPHLKINVENYKSQNVVPDIVQMEAQSRIELIFHENTQSTTLLRDPNDIDAYKAKISIYLKNGTKISSNLEKMKRNPDFSSYPDNMKNLFVFNSGCLKITRMDIV
ncbi:MAG: hypothetical protein ACTSRZ_07710 [Promethearchaeota archaeon]